MNYKLKNTGFSLTEVLMSVGILAVGMIFIAGVFPVSIYFTTTAAERTEAAIVADEAFAKIKLYGVDVSSLLLASPFACADFDDVPGILPALVNPSEFAYPSTNANQAQKQYFWSALCRLTEAYHPIRNPNPPVQVTVFVSRKIGAGRAYWDRDYTSNPPPLDRAGSLYPVPVRLSVSQIGLPINKLSIDNVDPDPTIYEPTFINDGCTIVDNETGRIYRVLERDVDDDRIILLDRNWEPGPVFYNLGSGSVWVVPPPVGGGRYPCIAVYQKVIRF